MAKITARMTARGTKRLNKKERSDSAKLAWKTRRANLAAASKQAKPMTRAARKGTTDASLAAL